MSTIVYEVNWMFPYYIVVATAVGSLQLVEDSQYTHVSIPLLEQK